MKAKRVSKHIWSLKSWIPFPIHVWVVIDEEGLTLVDAGIPMMAKGIMKFIKQLEPLRLNRIVLTHGHSDHIGSLKPILKYRNVPVYAHQNEIPFMEGDMLYPRRKKFEVNVEKGIAQPLQINDQDEILTISGLTPYLTPGHSPGHVVYYHSEDQVLLAGDLFTSRNGKLKKPISMFTGDMNEAVKSSMILRKLKPKQLEVCHGNTVFHPANQLEAYLQQFGKDGTN
ncbi:MBL fold metallo-hydrolase [Oceanobacillus chungangensis]|uniref:MBL fold metallo-hydrolase n=1 Tax=Oceanobacillus chungangensis TaxID=1229152 RepID=A0A3D8PJP9_9BACI|nr:MBL fold metallo-hydrolase [Oceanobacillus chungangensis]RDW15892.1 MBL fold metallo-hydrolase [Oceanobacillus chungangensis]